MPESRTERLVEPVEWDGVTVGPLKGIQNKWKAKLNSEALQEAKEFWLVHLRKKSIESPTLVVGVRRSRPRHVLHLAS